MTALPPEPEWRTDEAIMCLECGVWKKALGRHLPAHGFTSRTYRERWGMRQLQPLTSRDYAATRREIAIRSGGVERLTEWAPKTAAVAQEAARHRERRPQELAESSVRSTVLRAADRQAARDRVAQADRVILESGFGGRDEWIREHYFHRGMTLAECDRYLGVAHGTVQAWMVEAGIARRRTGPRP